MSALQGQIAEQVASLRNVSSPELPLSEPVTPREADQIHRTLFLVLNSVQFRSSRQCQDLLRYVIEQSLNNQSDLLRERVIGAVVFGRPPDYDTANDPIVRARMAEVRKRLAQYYQSGSCDASQIRIEIPHGHYRAIFRSAPAHPSHADDAALAETTKPSVFMEAIEPAPEAISLLADAAPRPHHFRWSRSWFLVPLAAVLLVAAALGVRRLSRPVPTPYDQFWAPVLTNPMPVIVYTGTNVVYRFTPQFLEQYRKSHHLADNGPEFSVNLPGMSSVDPHDLIESNNAYVTTGDVAAATAITSAMILLKKPYELRFAQDISPGDFHSAPIVLLGAFNNPWTLTTTRPLRFNFSTGDTIKDAYDPRRTWSVNVKPDGSTTDDYAIVSRLLSSERSGTRLTAAGIGEYGTQAAAEFLGSPQKIAAFARLAPAGWANRNLQIVIHVKVVDEVPTSSEIVAIHQW